MATNKTNRQHFILHITLWSMKKPGNWRKKINKRSENTLNSYYIVPPLLIGPGWPIVYSVKLNDLDLLYFLRAS